MNAYNAYTATGTTTTNTSTYNTYAGNLNTGSGTSFRYNAWMNLGTNTCC